MSIKTKNHAHLTDEEKQTINEIITICAAKIYHFVETYDDPKKYADRFLKFSKSRINFFLTYFVLGVMNMAPEQPFFPNIENKKLVKEIPYSIKDIANATLDLAEESSTYLRSWEMTDALQRLVDEGILLNIRGKDEIKRQVPSSLSRMQKGGGYENSKREGYYSVYKITHNLVALSKVISNPQARQVIHNKLRDSGVLEKFYHFMGLAIMHALMKGNENLFQLLTVGAQAFLSNNIEAQNALSKAGLDNEQIHGELWEPIKNYLRSLKVEELENTVKKMVEYGLDNSIDHSYVLLAISKL
jgi:hypothetical protein